MHNKKSGLGDQAAPDIESCKAGHDLQVNGSEQGNSYAKTPHVNFSSAFVAMVCDGRTGSKVIKQVEPPIFCRIQRWNLADSSRCPGIDWSVNGCFPLSRGTWYPPGRSRNLCSILRRDVPT